MSTNIKKPQDFITANSREGMKQYFTYDASDRMEYVYEAPVAAVTGDPCMKTQYSYIGVTTKIEKMKETLTTWTTSWDI